MARGILKGLARPQGRGLCLARPQRRGFCLARLLGAGSVSPDHYTMTHICLQLCVGKSRVLTTHYVLANVYLFNIKLSVGNKDIRLQVNCRHLSTGKKFVGKKF